MHTLVKWIAILFAGCLVLAVIGAILGGGKGRATPTPMLTARPADAAVAPTRTPGPAPAATATVERPPQARLDVEQALGVHYTATACDPEINAAWCSHLLGVAVTGDQVLLRTDLTLADKQDLRDMLVVTSAFVFNNQNKGYGLRNITAFSDTDGKTLAYRKGLAGKITVVGE